MRTPYDETKHRQSLTRTNPVCLRLLPSTELRGLLPGVKVYNTLRIKESDTDSPKPSVEPQCL
eukprot:146334-Pyramimonas_sp.AAC.1